MTPNEGDPCPKDHGNPGPCHWHEGKWHRGDGLDPCPYDQSNHSCWPAAD